ncbi:MAG: 3-oxoacyl-[acyl-carrier-protein] synthase III C-terminal domain-containing protein [Planctomycetota bacterium]
MLISGVSLRLPSARISNEEVLAKIAESSKDSYQGNLDEALRAVQELFVQSGIETRAWFDVGEPWFPCVRSAVDDALEQASCGKDDIDCIIYCSVYRTVLEPSMSCMLGKALAIHRATAFDVNEACGGWARAIAISHAFLAQGTFKRILIVSNEACGGANGYGNDVFRLKSIEDLEWAFPSFTIGNAATATVLSYDPDRKWEMVFESDNRFADYCLFPTQWPRDHDHDLGIFSSQGMGPNVFTCYGTKLKTAISRKFLRFVDRSRSQLLASDIFIPHTQAYKAYLDLFKLLKVSANIYSVFPKYGNIVTSSLPGTLADAMNFGAVRRGQKVFMVIPASGLSMASFSFVF